jgi:sugar lactone lactonase YvrE
MNRFLLVCVLGLLLTTGLAHAQTTTADKPQLVQHVACAQATANASHVVTCQFTTQNSAAGNMAHLAISVASGTISVSSVSDGTGSNTCTQPSGAKKLTSASPAGDIEHWICPNLTGGAKDTFTIAVSSGTPVVTTDVSEVSNTTGVVDQTAASNNASGSGTTGLTGTTSTLTDSTELCFVSLMFTTAKTPNAFDPSIAGSSGVTTIDNSGAATPVLWNAAFVTPSTLAQTMGWTWTTAATTNGVISCYPSSVQPVIVPHGTPTSGTYLVVTSVTPNMPASIANGDCAALTFCSSAVLSSPSCSVAGETWTAALSKTFNTVESQVTFFGKMTSSTSAPTCTLGVTATGAYVIAAFTPTSGSTCPTDGTPSANTGSSTSPDSPSDSGSHAGDMAIFPDCAFSATSITASTQFTSPTPMGALLSTAASGGQASAFLLAGSLYYPVTGGTTLPSETTTLTTSYQWAAGEVLLNGATPTATATSTATATATSTATATATSTATATATSTATATATATATPTASPTPSLNSFWTYNSGAGTVGLNWPFTATGNQAPAVTITCTGGCGQGFNDGMALDWSGHLWGSDNQTPLIFKLGGISGNTTASVTLSGNLTGISSPGQLCFDPSGNLWDAELAGAILKFSAASLVSGGNVAPIVTIPSPTYAVRGSACDSSGNIYTGAIDAAGGLDILKYNSSGTKLWENDDDTIDCSYVGGLAVDLNNNVFAASQDCNTLWRYNAGFCSTGTCTAAFNAHTTTNLSTPNGVGVDTSGNVYVASSNNNKLEIYTSTSSAFTNTASVTGASTTLNVPEWIALFETTPTATATATPTGVATPACIPGLGKRPVGFSACNGAL